MQGSFLRFYLHENQRCHGRLAWEWLLDAANGLGIRGGTAFRAMAGFGHQRHLVEAQFFELAGDLAVEVEFVVSEAEAAALLELMRREKLHAFYACIPARFGVVGDDGAACGG